MSHMTHARRTKAAIDRLAPLKERKSPSTAFLAGFFLGPLGIGLYLRSWRDFLVSLGTLIVGVGLGEFTFETSAAAGWVFAGFYGAYRAFTSNRKL